MQEKIGESCDTCRRDIDRKNIPRHIAFIMDGNRRWAKERGFLSYMGHRKGVESLRGSLEAAISIGVKVVTFYAFSTENWKRDEREISYLLRLFEKYMKTEVKPLKEAGVRFDTIGDLTPFKESLKEAIASLKEETKGGEKITLVLALNYGGRDDMRRACLKMAKAFCGGEIGEENFTENMISHYLDTASWEDPELLIRTSGEQRMSNFLLWQSSYSELYVTPVLWPDFSKEHFYGAVAEYQKRLRRLGS